VFDKDSNGTVSLAEIKAVLSEVYDENFDDLQELIGMKSTNGRLNFQQFVKLMTGSQF
jgi:Ca2+-binding EF-hand superfamily protein